MGHKPCVQVDCSACQASGHRQKQPPARVPATGAQQLLQQFEVRHCCATEECHAHPLAPGPGACCQGGAQRPGRKPAAAAEKRCSIVCVGPLHCQFEASVAAHRHIGRLLPWRDFWQCCWWRCSPWQPALRRPSAAVSLGGSEGSCALPHEARGAAIPCAMHLGTFQRSCSHAPAAFRPLARRCIGGQLQVISHPCQQHPLVPHSTPISFRTTACHRA